MANICMNSKESEDFNSYQNEIQTLIKSNDQLAIENQKENVSGFINSAEDQELTDILYVTLLFYVQKKNFA